jgi:two-component system chemotaxis sensor kinase CheA
VGVAVDQIVDIVREPVHIDLAADRPGVLGAAILRGEATEIVDVGYYLDMLRQEWTDQRGQQAGAKGRVLLVEQNHFTRQLLAPLLEAAGYEAVEAGAFSEALRLKAAGETFDAILADVDADPAGADAFAAQLEDDPAWRDAARLALTGQTSPTSPFADAVRKSDRAGLLAALDYAIQSKERAA